MFVRVAFPESDKTNALIVLLAEDNDRVPLATG